MNERDPITPLGLILFSVFVEPEGDPIGTGINILIGGIVACVKTNEKVPDLFDRVGPGETELVVSFVEFGLQGPLHVHLQVVVFL